ncbi:hypothetical protein VOLCADRAFT_95842 [Volvox carteri f. nagariensis]|uniref:Transmembrane protein n=1 Tax=Volvox carteri f. nagariensis TaxID=3068 RepID=D8U8I6_VOLCA|nr:uncharacterized protein VOLCADRAFT_95842 [Volvox carteri f. nagariensis]EFJ43987.1 hypothetical protein VOLCADRAFT_95842 [Volvox carteri f. nagariensis]|eukprot:XP_002954999.1 hypothetical protein VOLCADRAFT_95842 [Volvox carteri f. nagariensis]
MNITTVPTSSTPGQQTNESSGGRDSSSNNTDPGHSNNTGVTVTSGESPAAAWMVQPQCSGDYLFRIEIGQHVWWRWVVVDIDPPRLSGQLSVSKASVALGNRTKAIQMGNSIFPVLRYLLVLLNMSEPVHKFDMSAALQLSDSVSVLRAECFEDIETAAKIAGDAPTTVAASSFPDGLAGSPPIASPTIGQLMQLSDGFMRKYVMASGMGFVQSCLAVLYGPEGSTASITLPKGVLSDLTGNLNTESLHLETKLPGIAIGSSSAPITGLGGALMTTFTSSASVTAASTSFLSALTSRLSMLNSAYHFQVSALADSLDEGEGGCGLLAMTASLASPGVSHRYRLVAGNLRWSVMSIQGNIPILDTAFGKPMEVKVADQVNSATAGLWSPVNGTVALPVTPPSVFPASAPPEFPVVKDNAVDGLHRHRDRFLSSAAAEELRQLQEHTILGPAAMLTPTPGNQTDSRQAPPFSNGSSAAREETAGDQQYTQLQDVLTSFLKSLSQFTNGSNSTNNMNIISNQYVIVGVASGNGTNGSVILDPSGRVVFNGGNSTESPSPPMSSSSKKAATPTVIQISTQDMVYTAATVALLLFAVTLGHTVVVILYRLYLGPDLPAVLHFPRIEITLASPLLVAVTYYSCLTLSAPAASQSRVSYILAVFVLACIVLPYFVLLWWLTVCRWYLEEKPSYCTSPTLNQQLQTAVLVDTRRDEGSRNGSPLPSADPHGRVGGGGLGGCRDDYGTAGYQQTLDGAETLMSHGCNTPRDLKLTPGNHVLDKSPTAAGIAENQPFIEQPCDPALPADLDTQQTGMQQADPMLSGCNIIAAGVNNEAAVGAGVERPSSTAAAACTLHRKASSQKTSRTTGHASNRNISPGFVAALGSSAGVPSSCDNDQGPQAAQGKPSVMSLAAKVTAAAAANNDGSLVSMSAGTAIAGSIAVGSMNHKADPARSSISLPPIGTVSRTRRPTNLMDNMAMATSTPPTSGRSRDEVCYMVGLHDSIPVEIPIMGAYDTSRRPKGKT